MKYVKKVDCSPILISKHKYLVLITATQGFRYGITIHDKISDLSNDFNFEG
jgi:hypothetical protein